MSLQKCQLILTVRKFRGISNLTISTDPQGILAPEESLNWKNQSPCSQKHSFVDITTCKILQLAYISEIISKLYDNLQTQQLIGTASTSSLFGHVMNSFFINQACSLKNIGLVFSCVFMNIDCFSVNKNVKRQSYHPIGTLLYRLASVR